MVKPARIVEQKHEAAKVFQEHTFSCFKCQATTYTMASSRHGSWVRRCDGCGVSWRVEDDGVHLKLKPEEVLAEERAARAERKPAKEP